eukprot:g2314.t1
MEEDERARIRELLAPPNVVHSLHAECVQCTIEAGSRSLKVTLYILDGYPSVLPEMEVSSVTERVAPGVLRKLSVACRNQAASAMKDGGNGMPAYAALLFLKSTATTNLLLCAIDEIRKGVKAMGKLCTGHRLNEETGKVQIDMKNGNYTLQLIATVPPTYPADGIEFKMQKTNFPKLLKRVYTAQLEELIRRLTLGCTEEEALRISNQEKAPPNPQPKAGIDTKLDVHELKHDLEFLHEAKALRTVDADKGKRNQFFQHDTKTRKGARRQFRKLCAAETQSEIAQIESAQMAAAASKKLQRPPVRSMGPALRFIGEKFIGRLPQETCQGCGKKLLPDDPSKSDDVFSKKSKKVPKRVYCGHFWHKNCLNKVLTRPPFGQQGCPACGLRIWHHDWVRDIKKLERAWANKQAKKREINEVAEAFGLGAEFSQDLRKVNRDTDSEDDS